MFWGCFIALITTAFAFISRAFMINNPEMWPADFGLDNVQAQTLFGHGIWPFAISIILFSFIIDRIGYRFAMIFSFVCYAVYAALALYAYSIVNEAGLSGEALTAAQGKGYQVLTWGSIILGLGNGTVEAFINPVVATMFSHAKTKWLNILHAGWPGGLVLGGLITLGLGTSATDDWRLLIYIIAIPAVIYLVMLIGAKFPVNERVSAGATYKEMLGEFGIIGCFIAAYLIFMQLAAVGASPLGLDGEAFLGMNVATVIAWVAIIASVVGYGAYCKSLGRPLMIFLCLIMIPLATTELGTDGAITGIMKKPMKEFGYDPLWVLIYTSAIMMVLRFFAGPVIKALTPLGLLACCAALAIVGPLLLVIRPNVLCDLCSCNFVRRGQDLLLADDARRGRGTIPKRWSSDAQCHCRNRDVGCRNYGWSSHRKNARRFCSTRSHRRITGRIFANLKTRQVLPWQLRSGRW